MTSLAVYLFAAMVSWVPLREHRFFELEKVTVERYESIASDIAEVSLEKPIFSGDDGPVRTALLLASVASFESRFAARVDDCRVTGDHGTAFGLWQIHAPRNKVCQSRIESARLAREMMRASFNHCPGDVLDGLAEYTDGVCRTRLWRSRARVKRATKYLSTHFFDGDT